MFQQVGREMSDAVLDGYNGTVLCYGQTGAGKSFTMVGSSNQYQQRGLAPRCLAHVFQEASNRSDMEYKFRFSCLEIYNDTMYDLLSTLPSYGERHELSVVDRGGAVMVKVVSPPRTRNYAECSTMRPSSICPGPSTIFLICHSYGRACSLWR